MPFDDLDAIKATLVSLTPCSAVGLDIGRPGAEALGCPRLPEQANWADPRRAKLLKVSKA